MKLTPVQKAERRDFVLNRLKRGFSFLEVEKQFCEKFECCMDTARKWVNWACDHLAQEDTPKNRQRIYGVVVEMYHDQIVAYQNELIALQKEIDQVGAVLDRHTAILQEMEKVTGRRHRELVAELGVLPKVSLTARAALIEAKTRSRERMYKVMQDLARLRGLVGLSSDWRQAVNTLLDNNLLPASVADAILSVIENFENNIQEVDEQTEDLPPSEDSEFDPDAE
jgi:hypothetical protein